LVMSKQTILNDDQIDGKDWFEIYVTILMGNYWMNQLDLSNDR
jgi:hypothetical protein